MRFDTVIFGGTVFSGSHSEEVDLGICEGRIAATGNLRQADADERVDATGLWIFPGAIDTQVHFREPGLEAKENLFTGSVAAVAGGVTSVFEMPNTVPNTTSEDALAEKLRRASGRMRCNYCFFVGATTENADELGKLEQLPGTPGTKIFMGSSTGTLLVDRDEDLRRVLRSGVRPCSVHSEDETRNRERKAAYAAGTLEPDPTLGYPLNGSASDHPHVRDAESALISTRRLLGLSEETGRPVHILHLSTAEEITEVLAAQARGVRATMEITPQHLWFAAPYAYERLGNFAQMNPPVRSEYHRAALRLAAKNGAFTVAGSDHAPHAREEKAQPYPNSPSGMSGVQTLLPALLALHKQGVFSIEQVVKLTSEHPATLFGIRDRGKIEFGYWADLVLIDPREFEVESSWLKSKCGWSPYEGEVLYGYPVSTWVNGVRAYEEGEVVGPANSQPIEFTWK